MREVVRAGAECWEPLPNPPCQASGFHPLVLWRSRQSKKDERNIEQFSEQSPAGNRIQASISQLHIPHGEFLFSQGSRQIALSPELSIRLALYLAKVPNDLSRTRSNAMQTAGRKKALYLSREGVQAQGSFEQAHVYCEEHGYRLWKGEPCRYDEPPLALDWVREVMKGLGIHMLLLPSLEHIHPSHIGSVVKDGVYSSR